MGKSVFMIEEYTNEKSCINFKTYGYTHLRAFHACKPLRIEDYLKDENGIIYGHSQLPEGHIHKTNPHINILTSEGNKVSINIMK